MSLLSAKWIRALCTKPTFVVTQYNAPCYSRKTAEELDAVNAKNGVMDENSRFYLKRRELTTEESKQWAPLVHPLLPYTQQVSDPFPAFGQEETMQSVVPFGLIDHGYIARLSTQCRQMLPVGDPDQPLDPLYQPEVDYINHDVQSSFLLQPGETLFGKTVEYFKLAPSTVAVPVVEDRYLALGAIVIAEAIGAGSEGRPKVTIFNPTKRPIRIYTNQGIVAFMFFDTSVNISEPTL